MLDVSSDVIHFIPKSKDNLNKVERRCRWYLWYRKLFSTISPSARGWTTKKRCKSDLFKEVKRNEVPR